MQKLELPTPPLLAAKELLPACEQPPSPPAPPELVHQFPEPEDTTGQARRRATAGLGTRVGSRVLCSVISASLSSTMSSTSSTAAPVHDFSIFKYIMVCIICI